MGKRIMIILGPMRLPFLVLPPVCVALGAAAAFWSGIELNLIYLALAFVGALSAHISVNAFNEYYDFNSGLDFNTRPTPFSGGSGTLPKNPEKAHYALITAWATLAVTFFIGIYFLFIKGVWLLPLGLIGIIDIVVYTRWLTKRPLICLIAPGLGFGPLMVMGTNFVLSGSYSWTAFMASLVPFFLVSDLLLLNQFPDVEADKGVGRKHLPIVIGRKASVKVYAVFLAGAYMAIILGWLTRVLPPESLVALVTIALSVDIVRGISRHADDMPSLIPYMGRNVILTILTPVLFAMGLFIGR